MQGLLLILGMEFLVGVGIGFFLCDKEAGLSISEIKISSILFILVNIFLFWRNPIFDFRMFMNFVFSWILVIGGIIAGEKLRMMLVAHRAKTIQRQEIQDEIDVLLEQANAAAESDVLSLDGALCQLKGKIDTLLQHRDITDDRIRKQLENLKHLCGKCVEASYKVRGEMDPTIKSAYIQRLRVITGEISAISCTTLDIVEGHVKQTTYKRFNAMPQVGHTK